MATIFWISSVVVIHKVKFCTFWLFYMIGGKFLLEKLCAPTHKNLLFNNLHILSNKLLTTSIVLLRTFEFVPLNVLVMNKQGNCC